MTVELIDIELGDEKVLKALLDLNNAHAEQTSFLTKENLARMIDHAFMAKFIPPAAAMLIAFDQDAEYHSPNFGWFAERFEGFVYVDRIIVDTAHAGRGLGRAMYDALFQAAKLNGHRRVACEVNARPPNPGSDAFHDALGFKHVGDATLSSEKAVRYLTRPI